MANSFLVTMLRQIGDVVITTPVPRILKESFPDCRVVFLTEKPSDTMLANNPHVDEVWLNDRKGSVLDTLKLGLRIRRERFDVVIDYMSNPRTSILTGLSGAPTRIGIKNPPRDFVYTHKVTPGGDSAASHKLSLLEPLGLELQVRPYELYLTEEEEGFGLGARSALAGDAARMITVDPSHRRTTRKWPAEYYGELCKLLGKRWDVRSVILWGPGERELAEEVSALSDGYGVVAPGTTLRQMGGLIKAADLHLGNCSAPRHISVGVGTPTFTLLGATSPGWTYPAEEHTQIQAGLDCQPCNRNDCDKELVCLTSLEPATVAEELSDWAQQCLGWRR